MSGFFLTLLRRCFFRREQESARWRAACALSVASRLKLEQALAAHALDPSDETECALREAMERNESDRIEVIRQLREPGAL